MSIEDLYLDAKAEEDLLSEREHQLWNLKNPPQEMEQVVEAAKAEFESIPKSERQVMMKEFGRQAIEDDPEWPDMPPEAVDALLKSWAAQTQRREAGRSSDREAMKLAAIAFAEAEREGLTFAGAVTKAEQLLKEGNVPKSRRHIRAWLHQIQDCPFLECQIPLPTSGRPEKGK